MQKIWNALVDWLWRMDMPEACFDIVETMSPRERADLPVHHPRGEPRRSQRC